jgi:hypothetical protein
MTRRLTLEIRQFTVFKTSQLQDSLAFQERNLQEISITHRWDGVSGQDGVDPMDFARFSELKVLEISLPFVFGARFVGFGPDAGSTDVESTRGWLARMLPKSIRTLRLAHCTNRPVLKRLNVSDPSLKYFSLVCHTSETLSIRERGIPQPALLSLDAHTPL